MPPSGYDRSQVTLLNQFLRSCANALVTESTERAEPLSTALAREIADIERFLSSRELSSSQTAVLHLTKEFYENVLASNPDVAPVFWRAVSESVKRLESQILDIHIEPAPSPSAVMEHSGTAMHER